jgi:hypothetical protein
VLGVAFSSAAELRAQPRALSRLVLELAAPGVRSLVLFEATDELLRQASTLEAYLAGEARHAPPLLLGCGTQLVGCRGAVSSPRVRALRGSGARALDTPVELWLLGAADGNAQGWALAALSCADGDIASQTPLAAGAGAGSVSATVRAAEAALSARGALPPAPAAICLVGPPAGGGTSLSGFPPWLAHAAELYPLGALGTLRAADVRRAMRRFAATQLRGGA